MDLRRDPREGVPDRRRRAGVRREGDRGLVALGAANGEESWSFPTDLPIRAPPAVADGTVYVTTPAQEDKQGVLYAIDAESGEEIWRIEGASAYAQTPTVADGSVYLQETYVTARSADTGDEEWTYEHDTAIVPRTVAYADGTVYFGNKRSQSVRGTVFALDAASGEEDWNQSFEGGAVDGPIVSDGTLYVGTTAGVVRALDTDSGESLWDHSVENGIKSGLALADGRLYAVTDDETLHVLAEA
ncbi:PQQ-binding-like beta-propeller repeat protein [Halosimplex aquaticum]